MSLADKLLVSRRVGELVIVVAILAVVVDGWLTFKRMVTERAKQEIAASVATPAVTLPSQPVIEKDRGTFGIGRNTGGSGKGWRVIPTPTPIPSPSPGQPPLTPAEEAHNALVRKMVPDYEPPTAADAAIFEERFSLRLSEYRPLGMSEIPEAPQGGYVAAVQSRERGGALEMRWRPNPRPNLSFRQVFEIGTGIAYGADGTDPTHPYKPEWQAVPFYAAWEPGRWRDWHLRLDGSLNLASGRLPWQVRGLAIYRIGRPD